MQIWPSDVDGDVLRLLEEGGFDFTKPTLIDFNVEFETWPPSQTAIETLAREYPNLTLYEPEDEFCGDITFQVHDLVSYELVMRVQREVTDLMAPFGGRCDSWGVWQKPLTH